MCVKRRYLDVIFSDVHGPPTDYQIADLGVSQVLMCRRIVKEPGPCYADFAIIRQ
jgi:hypothetical protein